jgi:hypothetical protein
VSFPDTILDISVDLLLGGSWTALPSKVYARDSIRITRTRSSEDSTRPDAARAQLTFNDRDGRFSPNNPSGIYYGLIGKNTPLRISAGLGGTPTYRAVSTGSWTAGTASVAVTKPLATAQGDALIAFASADTLGTDHTIGITVGTTAGTHWKPLKSADASGYHYCWYKIAGSAEPASWTFTNNGSNNGTVTIVAVSGTLGFGDVQVATSALATTSAPTPSATPLGVNDVEIRYTASAANVTYTPPGGYTERADFKAGTAVSASLATLTLASMAATGVQTFTASGAVAANSGFTITVSSRSARFNGEVPGWPANWTHKNEDIWVSIEAAGTSHRLSGSGQNVFDSPATNSIKTDIANGLPILAAWPMEDGDGATSFGNLVPGGQAMTYTGSPSLATDSSVPGSKPLPTFSNGDYIRWQVPSYTNTGEWQVAFIHRTPAAPTATAELMSWYVGNDRWALNLTTGGNLTLRAYNSASTELLGDGGDGITALYGEPVLYNILARQVGGNFQWDWQATAVGEHNVVGASSGSTLAGTLGKVRYGFLNMGTQFASPVLVGQLYVSADWDHAADIQAALGYLGETAVARLTRLSQLASVSFDASFARTTSELVGTQRVAKFIDLVQDATDADGGLLYEPRYRTGFWYAPAGSLYTRQPTLDLTYTGSSGEIGWPIIPDDSDTLLVNDSTVTRRGGGFRRVTLDTGPLGTLSPPSGAGRYPDTATLNLYTDEQATYAAGWRVALGTYLDPGGYTQVRWPLIHLSLANMARWGLTGLLAQAVDLDIADRVTIDAMPTTQTSPNDVSNLVAGLTEELSNKTWDIHINGRPEGPWRVGVLGDTILGRPDSQDSFLLNAYTSGDTSMKIANTGIQGAPTLWSTSDTPYDLLANGERMTATAMASNAISFVSVGAATHADNASVIPGTPAGIVKGDLLLLLAAIRNTATGFVNSILSPGGYTLLHNMGDHFRLYGKIWDGVEGMPTVGFVGGAAGDTTSAQMAALRNAQCRVIAGSTSTNGSAQNIAYPATSPQPSTGDQLRNNCIGLILGWKQDDYTSVATIAGATEIAEASTLTGNDQSLTWDYVIQTTAAAIAAGSFVVTGGAAAVSKGAVVFIDGSVQTVTLTRAVNGVSKAQTQGTQVRLHTPMRLGR